ncbi:hypothetical protein I5M27_10105 [Adhaeribacter sp. BT258]|uniref:Glycosyltransferase RgtA/B/C/D-like domain-containing protein n=1 Tax=Adhaeribacter terrigena TaxID=2793070 RepID=A0ABS1C1R8_9BACT|nr:hypothetical protein [Adhaeribacter terrigena]MBK0403339.1 hypothetical protein [Adhaeribacter terrigena]
MPAIIHKPVSAEKSQHWAARTLPGFLYFGYALLVILSINNGFFWDSILLASRYGNWYFSTNFSTLFVPENIAGYPPLFGMYMALGWKIFGKSLVVSHLLILPFALGIVQQVLKLCRKFLAENPAAWAALLLLADPTLLAQCTQVAPDVLLVFLYLFSLNKILEKRRLLLIFSLIFLGLLSPRGTIAAFALFLTDAGLFWFEKKETRTLKHFTTLFLTYAPAGLLVIFWQILHFRHFGWIGYNPDSEWGTLSQFAGLKGMIRNAALITWRLFDFGRLFIGFGFLVTLLYYFRKRLQFPPETYRLFTLVTIPFFLFSLVFLPFTNPIGHRYYLVVFLLLALLVCYLLAHIPNRLFRKITYGFMLPGLLTGHFWIYPDSVAKGWDATLAHTPYFELRREAIAFLDEKNIPLETVGSDYPNLAPLSITNLNNDIRHFKPKDLKTDKLVLYSNIFNGFSDEELSDLQTQWQVVKSWKSGQVKMILYERK